MHPVWMYLCTIFYELIYAIVMLKAWPIHTLYLWFERYFWLYTTHYHYNKLSPSNQDGFIRSMGKCFLCNTSCYRWQWCIVVCLRFFFFFFLTLEFLVLDRAESRVADPYVDGLFHVSGKVVSFHWCAVACFGLMVIYGWRCLKMFLNPSSKGSG